MALVKRTARKCPVCVGCPPTKIAEINAALTPLLETVKQTGEVPKAADHRFKDIAYLVSIAPHSLRYHLKQCLVDLEIQDQRLIELKDLASALATAKAEYLGFSTMQNSTAYTQMLNTFMALSKDIEGQQDPEVTVEYLVEGALAPMSRRTLATCAEELRSLREGLLEVVPKTQASYIKAQIDSTIAKIASSLRSAMDDGLKNICEYYKVELEAQSRKRALESGVSEEPESKPSEEPDVH